MTNINFNEQFVGDFNAAEHSGVFKVVRREKAALSVFCKISGKNDGVGWSHK